MSQSIPAKHAEAALSSTSDAVTEARLGEILEAHPDGIVVIARDWKFLYANQRARQIVGNIEVVGHDIFELFPGNRDEPFGPTYRRAMTERTPGNFEAFHPAPLNLWLKVTAKPHPEGIVVFFSDVTARKQAELRATEASQRFAQVLELTSDVIFTLDREFRFTLINSAAKRLFDPGDRLLGSCVWDEFPAARSGIVAENYRRTMETGEPTRFETFYPEPLNLWFDLQTQPTPDGIVVFGRDITARREEERVINEQHELLAVVQRAARVATWELNPATGQLTFGPGAFPVMGHPLHTMNTLATIESSLLPGHGERLRSAIAEALTTGEIVAVEYAATTAAGEIVWIEARGQALKNAQGEACLRGMSIDITQRKLDQQELVTSEARYRVLADLNPLAIWMGDAQGNVTYANQSFLQYIGLTADNLDGLGWLEAFSPDDRNRVVEVWTRSVTTGEDYEIEARIRRFETGDYRFWHLRAAAVRDASGEILHWLGVAADVHDQKMAADVLRAEQAETERRRAELESVYKTSPVGLALFDPVEFRFLNLNDRQAELIGLPKEKILGHRLEEIMPIAGLAELIARAAQGSTVRDHLIEGEMPARPGERRAWSSNFLPIYNEDGKVRAISSASTDVTDWKKAETALVQSEKLAAVGRLASSISHEINNPLEAITNLLYLIALDQDLPQNLKVYVHMAQSELSRVSQIATQTLRFHRQAVNPTLVSAEDLVGAVVRLYAGRISNCDIKVNAKYKTSTKVLCFENDIRQVLNNLIANAIDAMRNGGRLLIRAHDSQERHESSAAARPGIRITIADTGHGMTPAVLARVFEPFYTTKDLNGTGLGLWISAGIVERHQGRMRVRSSVDPAHRGTIFTLFLPREETVAAAKN